MSARKNRPKAGQPKVDAKAILRVLAKEYPQAKTALNHTNALELLVATILSAQCTDERVNIVTKDLFKRYRTARDYAEADPQQLRQAIRSTGFFNQKADAIQACCRQIVERFGGRVPNTMEALTSLPGVARKTANVVLGTAFGKNEGIVVDTHVRRLAQRLGLSRESDPAKIERDLMAIVPRKDWTAFSFRLIDHGRRVCKAKKPACGECVLRPFCPQIGVPLK